MMNFTNHSTCSVYIKDYKSILRTIESKLFIRIKSICQIPQTRWNCLQLIVCFLVLLFQAGYFVRNGLLIFYRFIFLHILNEKKVSFTLINKKRTSCNINLVLDNLVLTLTSKSSTTNLIKRLKWKILQQFLYGAPFHLW